MRKFICPICGKEIADLSRHLVTEHKIKDADHLREILPKDTEHPDELKPISLPLIDSIKPDDISDLKAEFFKTILKTRHERRNRVRENHIRRLGHLIKQLSSNGTLVNEGIEAFRDCLLDNDHIIKQTARNELDKLLSEPQIDDEYKVKIRSLLSN